MLYCNLYPPLIFCFCYSKVAPEGYVLYPFFLVALASLHVVINVSRRRGGGLGRGTLAGPVGGAGGGGEGKPYSLTLSLDYG
jgi:hypothetical protein